MLMTDGEVVY